jgi:hypothetical protein
MGFKTMVTRLGLNPIVWMGPDIMVVWMGFSTMVVWMGLNAMVVRMGRSTIAVWMGLNTMVAWMGLNTMVACMGLNTMVSLTCALLAAFCSMLAKSWDEMYQERFSTTSWENVWRC